MSLDLTPGTPADSTVVPPVDAAAFRDAMARLAAAVHVVTSDGPAGLAGFTATAVCSVTDTPPTLLVCMNAGSSQNAVLHGNGVLGVNTLCPDGQRAGAQFAGQGGLKGPARFTGIDWFPGITGAPVLATAALSFDCRITEARRIGTHDVFFARVVRVRSDPGRDALVYFGRRYHGLPG